MRYFPTNTALNSGLTFDGPCDGACVCEALADPTSVTLRQHSSLVSFAARARAAIVGEGRIAAISQVCR